MKLLLLLISCFNFIDCEEDYSDFTNKVNDFMGDNSVLDDNIIFWIIILLCLIILFIVIIVIAVMIICVIFCDNHTVCSDCGMCECNKWCECTNCDLRKCFNICSCCGKKPYYQMDNYVENIGLIN